MLPNGLPWLGRNGHLCTGTLDMDKQGRLRIEAASDQTLISSIPGHINHLIVPGYIDSHVHFRQPGQEYKEGIANGSLAALNGGVTTVLDMPNTSPPTCSAAALIEKRRLWHELGRVGWGLFVGCNGSEILPSYDSLSAMSETMASRQIPTPASLGIDPSGIAALKVFMAHSGSCAAVTDPEILALLMQNWPRIAVHAEDETVFPITSVGPDHAARRPRRAVIEALNKLEKAFELAERQLGGMPACRLILLHVATCEEIAWVRQMKSRGYDIVAETCPHYLHFTGADIKNHGAQIQVNPPLRDAVDQKALWQALADGTIDIVSSDHAPHAPAEKASTNPPSGIPGIERMWPLMALAAETGRISWSRALALAAQNAARCYGMADRGVIANGARADLVLLRRISETDARIHRKVVTRAGYDAYRHFAFPWEVERVLIAGKAVWEQANARAERLAEEVYASQSSW
ncbi:MAG: Dihydroorotase [Candidatus Rifleibacterium amylolyticum]|nr:MAG: Dihydroorotase [Candidatus Rifleibacterium amylolyticum]NLF95839.1 amidohydrolase family protein [Candidatus Riflebacteria bacterium]